MLNGSREGKERWKFTCSILLLVLSSLSHLLYLVFPVFFVYPLSWYVALKAREGLRGVPQQYSGLEVQ